MADETPTGFDAGALKSELTELSRLSANFGSTLTRALVNATAGGQKLSDVLKSLVLSLSRQTLTAALKPFGDAIGGGLNGLFNAGPQAGAAPSAPTQAGAVNLTMNIQTPDIEGFRRSQSQVAALMVRALERGQRNL